MPRLDIDRIILDASGLSADHSRRAQHIRLAGKLAEHDAIISAPGIAKWSARGDITGAWWAALAILARSEKRCFDLVKYIINRKGSNQ